MAKRAAVDGLFLRFCTCRGGISVPIQSIHTYLVSPCKGTEVIPDPFAGELDSEQSVRNTYSDRPLLGGKADATVPVSLGSWLMRCSDRHR